MKTILPAKGSISKLWGCQRYKDTVYRLMKYLLRYETEDGVLLHNCVTGQLVLLSKEEEEVLTTLPARSSEPMKELIADHFLVPETFDEYSSVKQLRKIFQSRYTGDAINHYVILPTTFCNAHCFYCYESDYPRVHMTDETVQRLVEYIAEHCQGKGVVINWFGGEPLVGAKQIDQISQSLKDRGIPLSSSMITNGYLFDEEMIHRCVDLWHLTRVQITLDGTEKVYNEIKAFQNTTENPYQRVLRNIDLLSSNGIRVNIRLNFGFHNIDDIRLLIEELGEKYSGNQYVRVYLSMLYDGKGYVPVERSFNDTVTLMHIQDELSDRLKEFHLFHEKWKVPSLEVQQCVADNPNAVIVQPDGSFCRCEHENLLDSYGNLTDGILDPQKPEKWKETIERSDYCSECPIYPACYLLRYCLNASEPCAEEFRSRYIVKHGKHLKSIYQKRMEVKENEEV